MKALSLSFIFSLVLCVWGSSYGSTLNTDSYSAAEELMNAPSVPASNIRFTNRQPNSVLVKWNNGDGQRRVVLVRANSPVNVSPQDGVSYNGINIFGSGTDLGGGNFVIYNGQSDSIELSGLNPNTPYHFAIFEFNLDGGVPMYLRPGAPRQVLAPYNSINLVCADLGTLSVANSVVSVTDLKVINTGGTNAGSSNVGFYLSSDTTITNSDILLGKVQISLLPSNGIATISFSKSLNGLNIPPGTYFVGILVDADNQINEFSEDDNDCYWASPKVNISAGLPNFTCQYRGELTVNETTISLNNLQFKNNGNSTAGPSKVGFYLSSDLNFTTADHLIGSLDVGSIPANTTVTANFSISRNIINGLPGGTYYFGIILDYQNTVTESNEDDNNNCYFSSPTFNFPVNKPNLTCQYRGDLSVNGTTVTIENLKVINNGSTTAGESYIAYYLSADENFGPGDYKIGEDYVIALAPGASSIEYFSANVSSFNIPPGTYYVYFVIDYLHAVAESNESDNICYWTSPKVTIQAAKPNLTCEDRGSLTVNGTAINITGLKVKNTGGATAGSSYIGYYLSTDQNFTTSDIRIGRTLIEWLQPWEVFTTNFSVNIQNLNLSPGTYYVGIILDYENTVSESNESDNDDCFWTTPKVVISQGLANLTCNSTGYLNVSGNYISINDVKVRNIGNAASSPSYIGYYLSTDANITTSDIKIGQSYIPTLNPWETAITDFATTLNYQIPPGTYFVGIIIDYTHNVQESNEYDNTCYFEWPKVQIAPQKPNLTCYDRGNLEITGSWLKISHLKIWNNGNGESGATKVGYFLSTDLNFTTSDYFIGSSNLPWLNPGGQATLSFTYDLNYLNIPPGYYYVGVIIDYQNQVNESNEQDNNDCYWTSPKLYVHAPGQPNLTCKNKGWLSINGSQLEITGYEILNSGTATAPASYVGYYLSTDTEFTTSDYLIGEDYIPALLPGQYRTESFWKDLSGLNIPPGTYYVGTIIDYRHHVAESNEYDNNDCYWTSPKVTIQPAGNPNLTCYEPGNLHKQGNYLTISGTKIANLGSSAAGSSYVGYYLTNDGSTIYSDIFIGEQSIPSLSAGYYINVPTFQKDLTSLNIAPGTYHVVVKADNRNQVAESNEYDNVCTVGTFVVGSYSPSCACTSYAGSFCDDFDSYNAGPITPQSVCWVTATGVQGGELDARVVAEGGNKYLQVNSTRNTILRLGNRTSGTYELEFDIYPNSRASYNILHTFTPNNNLNDDEIGAEIYFNGDGTGFVRSANIPFSFTYPTGRWIKVKHVFDFLRNEHKFYVEGILRRTVRLNDTSTETNGQKKLAGVQFKPYSNGYSMRVDNVKFTVINGADDITGRSDDEEFGEEQAIDVLQPQNMDMTLAPNPARDQVVVNVRLPEESADVQLQLFDTKGQLLRNIQVKPAQIFTQEIQLTDIPPGTYYLRCIAGKSLITKPLVVVH